MSPHTPTPDGSINSERQFAQTAMDLLDHEVAGAVKLVTLIQAKYQYKRNTPENLEALRDEVLTRLMQIGIIATFDPTPCLHGNPPDLEIVGSTRMDSTDGFDHEQKGWEVNKSKVKGEDYHGQKGNSA